MFQELVCHTARPCAVAVEEMGNVVDAISFKTPNEGQDVYNGTENSELDDEDRHRAGRGLEG